MTFKSWIRSLGGFVLASSVAACVEGPGDISTESDLALLAGCAAPALGAADLCDAGDGSLTFQVTLPSGQQYVELFVRQNGIQNVATAIQSTGLANGDGTTTYALTRTGYAASDAVEYRFYSYRPASPGVFTPGPVENVWQQRRSSGVVTAAVSKDAAVIYSSLGTGPAAGRNFGSASSVDIGEYHLTSEGLFGYALPALPAGATVTSAEWLVPSAYAPGGPTVTLRLNRVTADWSESTVTWNTKPAYTYLREVTLTSGVANRVDVTAEVQAALASGSLTLAVQPSPTTTIDNVFIDAKEKVGGAPTSLSIQWRR